VAQGVWFTPQLDFAVSDTSNRTALDRFGIYSDAKSLNMRLTGSSRAPKSVSESAANSSAVTALPKVGPAAISRWAAICAPHASALRAFVSRHNPICDQ
jgi:hypothetical protein